MATYWLLLWLKGCTPPFALLCLYYRVVGLCEEQTSKAKERATDQLSHQNYYDWSEVSSVTYTSKSLVDFFFVLAYLR